MKNTAWYPMSVRPARNGVYETQTDIESTSGNGCGGPWFNYWDGSCWFMTGDNPASAAGRSHGKDKQVTSVHVYQWRGQTEQS